MDTYVGILAIGNEVVDGQITNLNAAWLSQQLTDLGALPKLHMSCHDNKEDIESALNYLSQTCHLIITSGGLGPTKDDFTRNVLSEWAGSELELDNDQWKQIQNKITQRNVTIREGHKRQAFIPKGAQALNNTKGVAPGFFIKASPCFLACLPGSF